MPNKKPQILLLVLTIILALSGCTSSDDARRILEADGYTNIQIIGYQWFDCAKDDFYHTGFTAQKNGKTISGTVCAGLLFKGATIRFK